MDFKLGTIIKNEKGIAFEVFGVDGNQLIVAQRLDKFSYSKFENLHVSNLINKMTPQ